jgi:hypothetical protein
MPREDKGVFVLDEPKGLTSEELGGSGQTALRMDLIYTAQDEIATETRYKDLGGTYDEWNQGGRKGSGVVGSLCS